MYKLKPLVSLLHEKVRLYLWTSVLYLLMSFFPLPCHGVCSITECHCYSGSLRWGWGGCRTVRRWTQPHLKHGPRGSTRASLPSGTGHGARVRHPKGHHSPAGEKWGHQKQKFATITTEAELEGTALKPGRKSSPGSLPVEKDRPDCSLWRGHLPAGSCPVAGTNFM